MRARQHAENQAFYRGGIAGTHLAGLELPEPSTLLMRLLAFLGECSVLLLTKATDTLGVVSAMAGATDATGMHAGGDICEAILALATDFASWGGTCELTPERRRRLLRQLPFFGGGNIGRMG